MTAVFVAFAPLGSPVVGEKVLNVDEGTGVGAVVGPCDRRNTASPVGSRVGDKNGPVGVIGERASRAT